MEDMVKCKVCGADIAKSATACPHCGARRRAKFGCLSSFFIFLGVVFFLLLLGTCARRANRNNAVQTAEEFSAFEPVTKKIDRWTITVTGVEVVDPKNMGLFADREMAEGSKYLVVRATVTNTGKDSATFNLYNLKKSTKLLCCSVEYKDRSYDYRALYNEDELLFKKLNPLESFDGYIAFPMPEEVAYTEEPIKLIFALGNKKIQFDI